MLDFKSDIATKVKRERALNRRNDAIIQTPIYKVIVKAHFQIPNKCGHRFKGGSAIPSKKLDSDEILSLDDLQQCLVELSLSNTKCGVFDQSNPPAMRMLDYLGASKEFCTRSEEIQSLPFEFQNITCNKSKSIDIGICNLNMGSSLTTTKKRKLSDSVGGSSLTTKHHKQLQDVVEVDNDSTVECLFDSSSMFKTSYNKTDIPLRFDLCHGRIESSTSFIASALPNSAAIGCTSSSKICQIVVLYDNDAVFKDILIERPKADTDVYDESSSSTSLHNGEIRFSGAVVFLALSELTKNLGIQPPFNAQSHSVYRVDQMVMIMRNEKATKTTPIYTTFAEPVKVDDVFFYPSKIKNVSFVVLPIDAKVSLNSQRAGGAFPRAVSVSESVIKTAVSSIAETVRKTLQTVAAKTFSGSLSSFIQNGLGCKYSHDTTKGAELLASISLVEQFISAVAVRDCDFTNAVTLTAVKLLIEDAMSRCKRDEWSSFLSSKAAISPVNLASVSPQPVLNKAANTLWSFLEDSECHVILETNVCVDLKAYSTTSIRKVVLVLQLRYKDIPPKTLFLVERFSSTAGSVEAGKELVGRFEIPKGAAFLPAEGSPPVMDDTSRWSPTAVKLRHTHFVIVDQESPEDA